MDDNFREWTRLVYGLIQATNQQRITWVGKRPNGKGRSSLLTGKKSFSAASQNALYELTSADSFGGAPYELIINETDRRGHVVPSHVIASSTEFDQYELNASLQELFHTVTNTIEAPAETVNRLLDGL